MGNKFQVEAPWVMQRKGTNSFSFSWPHHLFTLKVFCLPTGIKKDGEHAVTSQAGVRPEMKVGK